MNYEQLAEVNAQLKAIPLETKKGTSYYVPVNEQVKGFRMLHPNGRIETEMNFLNEKTVCFKATVYDGQGQELASGTAYEVEGSTFINRTSYIENCETSAIGRALSFCGIGIEQSIASYEEVANARLNQDKKPSKDAGQLVKELLIVGAKKGYDKTDICKMCKVESLTELSVERLEAGIKLLSEKKDRE